MQLLNLPGLAIGFPAFGLLLDNIYCFTALFLRAAWRLLLYKRERVQYLPLFVNAQNLVHGGV